MGHDIEEVLSSQKSMLKRQDRQEAKLSDDRLRAVFVHQVRQAVSNRQDYQAISLISQYYFVPRKESGEMGDKLAGALAACNKAHYLTQLNIVPHNKLKWN